MKSVIYKYLFPLVRKDLGTWYEEELTIFMPKDSKIIHIANQRGDFYIWAQIEKEQELVARKFRIIATGTEFDDKGLIHRGSALTGDGHFVWHIYEVVSE